MVEPDAGAARERRPDFAGTIWRRKWLVLLIALLALGLGSLYGMRATAIYQSSAQILLIKKEARLPLGGSSGTAQVGYEDTLSTHMILLRSPAVLNRAVEEHNLAELPSLAGAANPAGIISAGLRATRGGGREAPDPNVIDLTYEGTDPQDCATILNAVISSYQDFLGLAYQNFSEETLQLITRAKDELHAQLTEKESSYRKFRQESPLLWQGETSANMHETRMADVEKARSTARIENAEKKARFDAIDAAMKRGENQEVLKLLAGRTETATAAAAKIDGVADQRLVDTLLEEQTLLEKWGQDHPSVIAIRKKIETLRKHVRTQPAPESPKQTDFVGLYVESLRHELKQGEQELQALDALFSDEREAAKTIASVQISDETFRAEISRTQQLFNGVVKRLEELNLIKDYGGVSTQLIAPPRPGAQIQPNLRIILSVAMTLGTLAGLALAFAFEVADKRFRGPEEIATQLSLPVLGHIPLIEEDNAKEALIDVDSSLNEILCVHHRPTNSASESYRTVRTALYFSTQGKENRVIQITSPDPGDGKTTLAANLAISIAQSGKRVLVVDADFRRPKLAKLFGIDDAEMGLALAITNGTPLEQAVRPTEITNLDVMPCGPRPRNPSELLTSSGFKEMIDQFRQSYDFVILDSPPLLVVADATIVAAQCDAVMLVIRLRKNARDHAVQALEMLHTVGANVAGVVVNGISRAAGYSRYRYGYSYGYGYKYRYKQYSPYNTYGDPEPAAPSTNGKSVAKPAAR